VPRKEMRRSGHGEVGAALGLLKEVVRRCHQRSASMVEFFPLANLRLEFHD